MSGARTLVEAASLIESRDPFVLVSVVWRRGPSSGRGGSKAIILPDGTVRGWIGGACAEPTVIEHARQCLQTGEPELLFLGQSDERDQRARDGRTSVPMACESDGALEVYMEPIVPPVRVVGVGRSPAVDAMAAIALALGWDAWIIDDGGQPGEHAFADRVRTKLDFVDLGVDGSTAVVVATQGHYDDLALAAALDTAAGYIGLVASEARARSVIEQLGADGHPAEELARIDAPAGIDLGPIDNREIAASVIADLVARRARGELGWRSAEASGTELVRDPVCGMTVDPDLARYHSLHEGVDYWFCASGCKRAFDADLAGRAG